MRWEIFCQVIDNHGDLGVCLRLSRELATRGEQVRLWVDDASALTWMAPDLPDTSTLQVCAWHDASDVQVLTALQRMPADVLVEAFGCNPPEAFVQAWCAGCAAQRSQPQGGHHGIWINLEYLSAEDFVERNHGLMSPVAATDAVRKYFFYPGFTAGTGGLLREPDLIDAQAHWDRPALRARFGAQFGAPLPGHDDEWLVSLFCYEPAAMSALLRGLAQSTEPTRLLVTPGRAAAAVRAAMQTLSATHPRWNQAARLRIVWLPWLSQADYDRLLWACDFNFVRGEDSLVRALWAGRPFAWQLYEQSDAAHHAKLDAFLRWADRPADQPAGRLADHAPADWLALMRRWNGVAHANESHDAPLPVDAHRCTTWLAFAQALRERLLAQTGLTTALYGFVTEKR